ncbi:hypothetical protein H1R20_g1640, partial [Candolleomyces eurysporus]
MEPADEEDMMLERALKERMNMRDSCNDMDMDEEEDETMSEA